MEIEIQSTMFHTGDLVMFEKRCSLQRHPVEIKSIVKGMVLITDPTSEWLTAAEFAEMKPRIVGRVEKRWWGKKRVLS